MINRNLYLKKIIGFKDKQLIKVVTGIRRSGKSTILELYKNYFLENEVDESQIIYINFEDMDNEHLTTAKVLHEFISSKLIAPKLKNQVQRLQSKKHIKKQSEYYSKKLSKLSLQTKG